MLIFHLFVGVTLGILAVLVSVMTGLPPWGVGRSYLLAANAGLLASAITWR
jgi:hypothetical protein